MLFAIDSIPQENDAVFRLLHRLPDGTVLLMEFSNGALELQALGVLVRVGAGVVGVLEAIERGLLLPHGSLDPEELLLQLHVLVLRGRKFGLELGDGYVGHCFEFGRAKTLGQRARRENMLRGVLRRAEGE